MFVDVLPAKGRVDDLAHDESAQHADDVLAEEAGGQVGDEDTSVVEDRVEVKLGVTLANNIADGGVSKKGRQLVEHSGNAVLGDALPISSWISSRVAILCWLRNDATVCV